jgi:hypothetical protein
VPRVGPLLGALVAVAAAAGAVSIWQAVDARGSRAAHSATPVPTLASAGAFLRDEVRLKTQGRWQAAWRRLYPFHQRIARARDFVACERRTPFPARLQSLRVLRVRRSPVWIPGLEQPVDGVTVTVRVALSWYGERDPITFTHAFHLVPAHGHWTWLLSEEQFRLYTSAGCSSAPAV